MAKKIAKKSQKLQKRQNGVKYFIGVVICLLFRLIPFRSILLPNVEPLTATIMPFSKVFRWWSSFIFGVLSIVIYDFITQEVGIWTWVTAVMYGLMGVFASMYLAGKPNKIRYYLGYSIVATLIYDAVTGIGIGVLAFNMPFMQAFLGQIPFTAYHLAGNIVFAIFLSPLIYDWIADNKRLETSTVLNKVKNAFSA